MEEVFSTSSTKICDDRFLIGATRPREAGMPRRSVRPFVTTTEAIYKLSLDFPSLFSAFATAEATTLYKISAPFLLASFKKVRASCADFPRTSPAITFAFFGEMRMCLTLAFIRVLKNKPNHSLKNAYKKSRQYLFSSLFSKKFFVFLFPKSFFFDTIARIQKNMKIAEHIQRFREMVYVSRHGKKVLGVIVFILGFSFALLFSGESVQDSSKASLLASPYNNTSYQENGHQSEEKYSSGLPKKEKKEDGEREKTLEKELSWAEEVHKKPKKPRIGLTDRMTDDEIAATFSSLWGAADDISEQRQQVLQVLKEEEGARDITKEHIPVESIDAEKKLLAEKNSLQQEKKISLSQKKISLPSPSVTKKVEKASKKFNTSIPIPKKKTHKKFHYADGVYSAVGSYKTRSGNNESVSVRITLANERIAHITVMPLAKDKEERKMQVVFARDVSAYVQGERIDAVPVFAAVDGKSFVPKGFQRAIASIREQARQ